MQISIPNQQPAADPSLPIIPLALAALVLAGLLFTGGSGNRVKVEQHGATSPANCKKMEARFIKAGRKVRLARTARNKIGSGGVLDYICIFEGEDATEGYYSRFGGQD